MAEPLVLKISIDKGNAVVDVQQVATALAQLETQEKQTGKGASGMVDEASQSFKGFFQEQRLQDKIMNEGKQSLLGMSSAYVMLSQSMGNGAGQTSAFETSLTQFIMTANAGEFALFSMAKAGSGLGGTLGMIAGRVGGLAGPISMVIGVGAGLISFFSKSNEEAGKAAQEGLAKFNEQITGMSLSDLEKVSAGIKKRFELIREERLKLQNSKADLPPDGMVSKETIDKATAAFEQQRATRLRELQEQETGLTEIQEKTEKQLDTERKMKDIRALGQAVLSDNYNTIQSIHAELEKIGQLEKQGDTTDEHGISLADKKLQLQAKLGELTKGEIERSNIAAERAVELEKSKTDAMKDGAEKRAKMIEDDAKAEGVTLQKRLKAGEITNAQWKLLDKDRLDKKEARLTEMWEFEKQQMANELTDFEKHDIAMKDLNEQLALAMTATNEDERLLHKQQLLQRVEDFKAQCELTLDEQEQLTRALIELRRMEKTEETKDAAEIREMKKTLREFQIEDIETDLGRELAMIDEKYNEEVRLAEGNAEKIQLIEQRKSAEVERAHKKSVDEYTELEDKLGRELTKKEQKLAAKIDPIANMLSSNVSSAWASIIDSSQTGAEKWANIMEGMKQTAWSAIGAIVERWIQGQLTMFLFNLLNPVGALTGKTIDSGVSGFGTNLAMTAPNVGMYSGTSIGSGAASSTLSMTGELLAAVKMTNRLLAKQPATIIESQVDGERFTRRNMTTAERNRARRTKS